MNAQLEKLYDNIERIAADIIPGGSNESIHISMSFKTQYDNGTVRAALTQVHLVYSDWLVLLKDFLQTEPAFSIYSKECLGYQSFGFLYKNMDVFTLVQGEALQTVKEEFKALGIDI